jgi:hypothetical protein
MKGTFDNQQSKGSSTINHHLLRLVVSSTNWQMVMKLTMVGISRTWVRSAWSIVVISLAVGTGSVRHFVDWIWNWERYRLFVIETMWTEEWNGWFSKSIEINHIEIPFLDLDLPIFVSFEEETRLGREEKEPMMGLGSPSSESWNFRYDDTGIEEDCHRSR